MLPLANFKMYGWLAVGAAFLMLGIYAGYQKLHVERLKAQIAAEHEAHAIALSKALADQAKVLDTTAQKERERVAKLERDNRNLRQAARKAQDALHRMSDYLRIIWNGVLDSANEQYGGVLPATPAIPAGGGETPGRPPSG